MLTALIYHDFVNNLVFLKFEFTGKCHLPLMFYAYKLDWNRPSGSNDDSKKSSMYSH